MIKSGIITQSYLIFDLPAISFNCLCINIISCANPSRTIYIFGFYEDEVTYDTLGTINPSSEGCQKVIDFSSDFKVYKKLRIVEQGGDSTTNTSCCIMLYRKNIEDIQQLQQEVNENREDIDNLETVIFKENIEFSTNYLEKTYKVGTILNIKLAEYEGSAPVYIFGIISESPLVYDTIVEDMQVNQEVSFVYNENWTCVRFYKNDNNNIKFIKSGIQQDIIDIQQQLSEYNSILNGQTTTQVDIDVNEGEFLSITFLSSSNDNPIYIFGMKETGWDDLITNGSIGIEYSLKIPSIYNKIRLYCLNSNISYKIKKTNCKKITQDNYLLNPYPENIPYITLQGNLNSYQKNIYVPSLKDKYIRFKIKDLTTPESPNTFYLFGMISESSWDDLIVCQTNEENVIQLTKNYSYLRVYQAGSNTKNFNFYLSFFDKNILNEEENDLDEVDRLQLLDDNPLAEIKREPGYGSIIHQWGIIGDSLSSGCTECREIGTSGKIFLDLFDYSWGQCLFRLLGVEGYNFSYSGQQTKPWCLGWTQIQTTSVPPSTTLNPEDRIWDGTTVGVSGQHGAKYNPKQGYIIALGVNDASRNEFPLGTISDINLNDYTQNGDSFYGYYAGIIQRIRSIAPRCFVFCVTRPGSGGSTTYDKAIRDIVPLFNRCYCIDLANGVAYNSAFTQRYYLGGHMNAAGYEYTAYVMNTYIDWIIRNNFGDFKDAALVNTQYEIVPS